HLDRCNTLTINYLKVVTAGPDHDTSGIEPILTLFTNDNTASQQVWSWGSGGGSVDMHSGDQRGPDAFGFPITRTICGESRLEVDEDDGTPPDEVVASQGVGPLLIFSNFTLTFSGAGHTVEVNVTVPARDDSVVDGALLNANGAVQRNLSFPRPTIPAFYK